MEQTELIKILFFLLEDIDKVNIASNCSEGWKQQVINEKLHAMVGPLALLGDFGYSYPHEESWDEETAFDLIQYSPRANPALYQSALSWLKEYGSDEIKNLIGKSYNFSVESDCEFYEALDGFISDEIEKEKATA